MLEMTSQLSLIPKLFNTTTPSALFNQKSCLQHALILLSRHLQTRAERSERKENHGKKNIKKEQENIKREGCRRIEEPAHKPESAPPVSSLRAPPAAS
jgi:hypothetical protein